MDLLELRIFIFATLGTLDPEANTDQTWRSKSGVPKVWTHHSMKLFMEISMENTRIEKHSSKQVMVYEQIPFFYEKTKFSFVGGSFDHHKLDVDVQYCHQRFCCHSNFDRHPILQIQIGEVIVDETMNCTSHENCFEAFLFLFFIQFQRCYLCMLV